MSSGFTTVPGFDQFNDFRGTTYGVDRRGHTTPSPDACDEFRPFMPVPYPAAWLPIRRRAEGHPVAAGVVLSEGYLIGVDKSGALIPAGYTCGDMGTKANGGQYCVIVYSQYDVGTVTNPQTGLKVQAAGEHVVLAAPTDGVAGDQVTLPDGIVVTISAGDVTWAHACTLIPGGKAKAVGFAVRDVFVYIGGIQITDPTLAGGIKYLLLTQRPDQMQVTNYMHEMGTCIQTRFVLRLPWIGATPSTLTSLAATDGVLGYVQTDYSRSFVHFTGAQGNVKGTFYLGCAVVPNTKSNGSDAGHYAPYDPAVNEADDICGRVMGVELMYPIIDYANRVRTQYERATEFVGPRMDPNPVTFQMGGSATKGMDYAISITTNGLFQLALGQQKPVHNEYATYVLVHVNCR
jgi:hypothetical protein